jgi:predicted RNase H-like HicB family nuclease
LYRGTNSRWFDVIILDVTLRIETEREVDGRWIAEAVDIPGVLAYGVSRKQARSNVEGLALRVLADRQELGELTSETPNSSVK